MAWSLGSVTIHPAGEQDRHQIEAYYAIENILDATTNYIAYFGAGSERKSLEFILDEDVNSNSGLTNLKNSATSGSSMPLSGDTGSMGNWKIISLEAVRKQALNHTYPVYSCSVSLIKV